MPPVVAAAGIGAAASIAGGIIGSKASKSASQSQADAAREALAEQKRIYDIEAAKEARQEQELKASRQNAFGGFGGDLSTFSQGYAPAYGMSAEQTSGLLAGRNAAVMQSSNVIPPPTMNPVTGPKGPRMRPGFPGGEEGPLLSGGASSLASTVWLEAPTGETMEVSIADAPMLLGQGAKLLPGPPAGGPYGMV